MRRISDKYLALYLEQLDALKNHNPVEWMHEEPWRLALAELRASRAAALSAEDIEALEHARGMIDINTRACRTQQTTSALAVLDRLIAAGGGR